MLEQNASAPSEEYKIWLPKEYEDFLRFSHNEGDARLMAIAYVFYNQNMHLVVDLPTFDDADIFVNGHCEEFCRRVYYHPIMFKSHLEIRINGVFLLFLPMSLPFKRK